MFHVCLLSVVLFHSVFMGLALKLKVDFKNLTPDYSRESSARKVSKALSR
jgi:hypothetical protein